MKLCYQDGARTIPLTRGKVAIVDVADFARLNQFSWHAKQSKRDKTWYAGRTAHFADGNVTILMHRFILGLKPSVKCDHRDHDGLNNRRSNLRTANDLQSAANRPKQRNNTSGYVGVAWHARSYGFRARISAKGKSILIGAFKDPVEAAKARDAKAVELFGEFAVLNFPTRRPTYE